MLADTRRQKILEELEKNGMVKVAELCVQFNVTRDCIRKDLTLLEQDHKLRKTYGGAVKDNSLRHSYYVSKRKSINLPEKRIVAKKAFKLIKENDTIYLGISTINLLIMQEIVNNNLHVNIVTNMLDIINMASSEVSIICTGGYLNETRDGFTGSETINYLDNYHFDKAFIGVVGIDLDKKALYTYEGYDGNVKRKVIEISDLVYVLAEGSKIGRSGNYKFASLESVSHLVTDKELDKEILDIFSSADVFVI